VTQQPATLEKLTAALADRYAIEREIGAGGMATVYLAEDVRHHRKVAIKVLHPELSALLGPERFLKEIELTANLQHPHILPLFDSGNADGHLYYVMPFVEGETLRRRLEREQQLPIADAVRTASDVADALEYAHKRGVIHRDIKPENILLHDGRPLVADFGIALAVQQAGGARMTQTGMSLGTPQYMAPEQAMGDKSVDHRADIYALGAVTYEMLAGEPPFAGPNSQAVVAKVLTTDPIALRVKRRSVPEAVEDAVLTALEKMPADRFASAAEFSLALAGSAGADRALPAAGRRARATTAIGGGASRRSRPVLAGASVLLLLAAGAAGWALRPLAAGEESAGPVRFAFKLGAQDRGRPYLDISPDGRRVIQSVADSTGTAHVLMRDLGTTEIVTIEGTEDAEDPAFSPDGEWISFSASGKLRKVPSKGGPPTDIADSAGTHAWTPAGDIVFTRGDKGIWRVRASGGAAEQLTRLDTARREFQHWFPQGLPGNRGIIYTSYATPAMTRSRIEAYDFRSRKTKVLVEGAMFGRYSRSGHLLYVRNGAIFAVPFDARSLEVRGDPVPVQDDVAWLPQDGLAGFAVSPNGTMVYIRGSEWNVQTRLAWVNRAGVETPVLPRTGAFLEPRLSPDERWISLTITQPKRDLWLYDISRGVLSRLTNAGGAAFGGVWARDSRSLVYSDEDPIYDLRRIAIDGGGEGEYVVRSRWDKHVTDISHDGTLVAYSETNGGSTRIHVANLEGNPRPRAFPLSARFATGARFSPSGRWLVYQEAGDGRSNVFVMAADGSRRRQVSIDGGSEPSWTRGGREIVYRRGGSMMAVDFDPSTAEAGRPRELFRLSFAGRVGQGAPGYDVTADGNRFLFAIPVLRPEAQPTIVTLNWFQELRAKVGR